MKKVPRGPEARAAVLERRRVLRMARSAHAYVRGSTERFYEWIGARRERPASCQSP